jgi:hypothetical protein
MTSPEAVHVYEMHVVKSDPSRPMNATPTYNMVHAYELGALLLYYIESQCDYAGLVSTYTIHECPSMPFDNDACIYQ